MALSALFEKLVQFVKEVLKLADVTEKNSKDIVLLQEQITELNEVVRALTYEIKHNNERQADERERAELRMANFKLEIKGLLLEAKLEDQEALDSPHERKKLTE